MISKDTCEHIWHCHREIAASEKLLEDLAAEQARQDEKFDKMAPQLNDAFGRKQGLQLGVPSGESGHRIYNVAPDLAISIIRAHIANKQAELTRFNEQARIEIGGV